MASEMSEPLFPRGERKIGIVYGTAIMGDFNIATTSPSPSVPSEWCYSLFWQIPVVPVPEQHLDQGILGDGVTPRFT